MKIKISKYPRNGFQKAEVRIDQWDTYSTDVTLARIILPLLLQLKDRKHGVPSEFIRGIERVDYKQECFDFIHEDRNSPLERAEKEWNEILDKMIWSFQQILTDDWNSNYHHGKVEIEWKPIQYTDPATGKLTKGYEMDNDSSKHWYDRVGHELHYQRIQEGLELFGKYMHYLWE